ncbi:hypothetical protein RDI58_001020 [Solanum bulbocastanum]|uniref:Uncharacterized protein n=1 Tax=Solanum bulbocastanum TaxID=147425 RepID=A0AAN8YPS1_SOLBU
MATSTVANLTHRERGQENQHIHLEVYGLQKRNLLL